MWKGKNPIYFGVIRSKVKVIVTINIILTTGSFPHDNFSSVYLIFTKLDHMIPLSLVKIQYTELKLSCGNNPVVNNYIYSNSDFDQVSAQ
jgi:hypothetical protein